MNQTSKKCLVIDGNNLLYRCYHASRHLPWESKVKAIFIFLRIMSRLLSENNYQKLLIVFDSAKTNFRHQILLEYKINRLATPPELLEQMNILQNLLIQSTVPLTKLINFEADDLIASFAFQNSRLKPNWIFDIFSQDKDLRQLLSNQINIFHYAQGKIVCFAYRDFYQEYNFLPSSYVDYLCLLGDKVDNIVGVNGIGKKSAQKLIQEFGTIENLYQNLSQLTPKTQDLLAKNQKLIYQNKQLINLKKDLILPINWEQCNFNWEKWKNNPQLIKFCQEYQFKSILKLLASSK
jgi:DNA polymerase I